MAAEKVSRSAGWRRLSQSSKDTDSCPSERLAIRRQLAETKIRSSASFQSHRPSRVAAAARA
jgi:hypothetical protein